MDNFSPALTLPLAHPFTDARRELMRAREVKAGTTVAFALAARITQKRSLNTKISLLYASRASPSQSQIILRLGTSQRRHLPSAPPLFASPANKVLGPSRCVNRSPNKRADQTILAPLRPCTLTKSPMLQPGACARAPMGCGYIRTLSRGTIAKKASFVASRASPYTRSALSCIRHQRVRAASF